MTGKTYEKSTITKDDIESIPVDGPKFDQEKSYGVTEGKWRYGLFSCLDNSALCGMGWLFTPIVLGQIMQRMGLNMCGCPNKEGKSSMPVCAILTGTFVIVFIACLAIIVIQEIWGVQCIDGPFFDFECDYRSLPPYFWVAYSIVVVCAWYIWIAACCTRMHLREKTKVEGEPYEDCFITMCCNCCSVIQMARQTHDEEAYPYRWQSKTGLGPDAPSINSDSIDRGMDMPTTV